MLSVFGSPTWRTVVGGSATYVDAIANHIDEVRRGAPVRSVRRVPDGVEVTAGTCGPRLFDAAVIATHPDQALLMLAEPTSAERAVLGAIGYSTNHALASHRRVGAAAASPCPCVVELPGHTRRRTGAGHLRREPADAAERARSVPGDARRPRPRRPGDGACGNDLQPSDVHAGVGCRPTASADPGRRPSRVRGCVPRLGLPRGRRGLGTAGGATPRCRMAGGAPHAEAVPC